MYQKPVLERFGDFRELTQYGLIGSTDGGTIQGISSPGEGCENGGGFVTCPKNGRSG
jgi:hypothetical protein